MKNKLKVLKNKRAFTLIELITTIAVLAILVLIAMPRFTGYTQKAELARIQHDTKIMEQEMSRIILDNEGDLANWDDNAKDLGALILKNKLFEKEGLAERIDKSHLERHYNRAISASNGSSELGVGGTEILLLDEQEEVGDGYKIIPDYYKSNIKTRLSGTFYTNELGKVYYEHDKPLTTQKDSFIKKCDSPVAADLGYTFNYDTMTITGYDHREQHLVIPESFKNPETDECVPVRIIGKGAFMIGGYKSVVIPESVHTIEEEAFINNEFTNVYIPHSVDRIGSNAFTGDYISSVTIGRREESVNIGGGAFYNRTTGRNITPRYKIPSASGLGYIFDVSRGAIVSYSSSNRVLTIPSVITVNGVEYEVKQIDKGAFQGLGLITVILPEGLERIEDYAFSGNQLIGVTIPESVVHIGNYAFSFNEQTHSLIGKKRATIKTVMMYEGGQLVEQVEDINQQGDILENSGGPKVNLFDGRMTLLDHIFVTSIGNHVVDEEYSPKRENLNIPNAPSIENVSTNSAVVDGGKGTEVSIDKKTWYVSPHHFTNLKDGETYEAYARQKETDNKFPSASSVGTVFNTQKIITFRGLSSAAYDGNPNTFHRGAGTIWWDGDISGRTMIIRGSPHGGNWLYPVFYDVDGNVLLRVDHIEGYTIQSRTVIVPNGAVRLTFTAKNMTPSINITLVN